MEQHPSYQLAIVDQTEFNMLSLLGDYKRCGNYLSRMEGNIMYVTMLQTEYERMQILTSEVDEQNVAADDHMSFYDKREEFAPSNPSSPAAVIPQRDTETAKGYGIGLPVPERGPSNRPVERRSLDIVDFSKL